MGQLHLHPPDLQDRRSSANRYAFWLALGYCIVGLLLWTTLFFSVVEKFGPSVYSIIIESVVGLLFVGVTTVAWYFIVRRLLRKVNDPDSAPILEHLQAQAEIAKYQDLFEAAEDNILLFDTQKRCIAVTDRVAALVGRTAAQMIGKTFDEAVPERSTLLNESLDTVIASGQPVHMTSRMTAEAGDLWYDIIYTPIMDSQGGIISILVVGRDVTSRVVAEDKLREQTAQYKALLETISLIGNTLKFDEVLEGLLSQMRMIKADSREIFWEVEGTFKCVAGSNGKPRDADAEHDPVAADFSIRLNASEHKDTYLQLQTENVLKGCAGTADPDAPWLRSDAPVSWMLAPMIVRGRVAGFLSMTRTDLVAFTKTEEELFVALAHSAVAAIDNAQLFENLARSEADYRELIDSVDDMVYRADGEGNLTYVNAKGRMLEELDEGDNALIPWRDLVHPDDVALTSEAFGRGQTSDGSLTFQNRIVGKKGRITHLSHRARISFDQQRKFAGVFGIARDITDLVRQQNALAIHAHQQAVVASLGAHVLEGVDQATLMDEISSVVAATLKVELASVLELLPDGKQLIMRAGYGWGEAIIGHLILDVDRTSQAGYALLSHEPVFSEDSLQETRFELPQVAKDRKVRSTISVIIEDPDGPYGVLGAQTAQVRAFTPDDISFLQAVANLLATAIVRTRAEQALRDSEERNRSVVNAAGDGILTLNAQGFIQWFNPAAERLFGYSIADAQGLDFRTLIAAPQRIMLDSIFHVESNFEQVSSYEIAGQRRDNTTFAMDLTVSQMYVDGQHMFTGIVRDVSERVKSEQTVAQHAQQLATLNHVFQVAAAPTDFDQILDALLTEICDVFAADAADIHLLDDNVGLLYLLAHRGYELTDEEKYRHFSVESSLRGQVALDGRVAAYSAPFPESMHTVSKQESNLQAIAITPIWARGSLRGTLAIMMWTERRFESEDLALLEALGRSIGITIENARLHAEAQSYAELLQVRIDERTQELQKALIHAQSADRTKSALLSTVSHEMRTPLSSIIGFSNLILSRRPEIEKTIEFASAINAEARRLADLINDFLDLQRIEAGRDIFHFTQTDLGALVHDIIRTQQLEEDTVHTMRLEISAVPPVHGDPDRLRQVILNLLSNALKYSPNGGEITIGLNSVGTEVIFSIKDQGLGIGAEDMALVFDHFYRGDAAERHRIRGTGLGLGLCREIISRHSGRIWGQSPGPNLGSTFSFALPTSPEYAIEPHDFESASLLSAANPVIVLIEDDINFSNYITERLASEHFRVRMLYFEDVSIARIAEIAPALIMLDLIKGTELPGWTFLELLKNDPATRHIPVLICSAQVAPNEAREKGAQSFVAKPVNEQLLVQEINRLLA